MPINESQLDTWSALGSVQQSAATYKTISDVLNHTDSSYYPKWFNTFLQGSYGNDTNIYADSDVDTVICLTSVYYSKTSGLSSDEKSNFDRSFVPAQYSLAKFKEEVTGWLAKNFGAGVKAGSKAIFVPANGARRNADVLACAEHREYYAYPATGQPSYREGIIFWKTDGTEIINYPKQHSANCTTKHQNTGSYFKPTVRIFKNMRNRMISDGSLKAGVAPSYYLEGLVSNVPTQYFGRSYQQTITNCIDYISKADTTKFHCANGIHYLLRHGHDVCWSPEDFATFMAALKKFWG